MEVIEAGSDGFRENVTMTIQTLDPELLPPLIHMRLIPLRRLQHERLPADRHRESAVRLKHLGGEAVEVVQLAGGGLLRYVVHHEEVLDGAKEPGPVSRGRSRLGESALPVLQHGRRRSASLRQAGRCAQELHPRRGQIGSCRRACAVADGRAQHSTASSLWTVVDSYVFVRRPRFNVPADAQHAGVRRPLL